ncbi:unnamed protein product [Arabis nemorensis]|uniref:Ribonucleoside-diphosphate reductase n=1 Tax=Arabis nemorensis TaxID=586526 RepID=A0A565BNK6_9BRAS|nr:unnamed protein product [Arabis nemorensis]
MESRLSPNGRKHRPLGLQNRDNNCYLNSVLQCLTFTTPLADFCLGRQHSSKCHSLVDGDDCPFCILEKRITRSLTLELTHDEPGQILSSLGIFAKDFAASRQEDAHEFLRCVIHACQYISPRLRTSETGDAEPFTGESVLKEIFGGALQSRVECPSCEADSIQVEETMDISLDISHSDSVKESLQMFFEREILDDNNKFTCAKCNQVVKATKQLSLLEAPNVLVIHLKRFDNVSNKIEKPIAFDKILVLSSFLDEASKDHQAEYELFGVILHSGSTLESGHYCAYVKDSLDQWYCCDDMLVSLSTLQGVSLEEAYILFYSRSNQRPASAEALNSSEGSLSMLSENVYVVERDFDKITARLKKLSYGLSSDHCDPGLVAQKVCATFCKEFTTDQLDELAADIAAAMTCSHPDYASLAARIAVSNLHQNTKESFSETVHDMFNNINERSGLQASLLDYDVFLIVEKRLYLMKIQGKVVERPQHMLMRVALGIHTDDIESAIETYHLMSQRWFTHASPTLCNAGTPRPQLSSCFLICMKDDSFEDIYETLKECVVISNSGGSIGVSVHNAPATGSYICGTNGMSNGIAQLLRVLNNTAHYARYVDQGGGKPSGAFAVYLEPWHADIYDYLELGKNDGKEEHRARDLSYALWVPDLFMQRVKSDGEWSLFCPNEAPGLADCWGKEFESLYMKYEREGKAKKVVEAQDLWLEILISQLETGGMPYMLFKDTCNRKSNQQNVGTITSSSLCGEVIEYSSPTETAVCNNASIALPRFVREKNVPLEPHPSILVGSLGSKNRYFDFDMLAKVTAIVASDLDKIIDVNHYPVDTARTSNMRHRPIGIGVQGLADAFILLGMPFDSPEARQLNKDIFETIYYHALKASSELTIIYGAYETYKGSPGILQPDMWNVTPSKRWDWDLLRDMISKNGVRNSLLVALMPTGSTSQILGNSESFEPYTSNIYSHRGLSGEIVHVNKHLLHDLTDMGLWSEALKSKIIRENGSVANVQEIPEELKKIYRVAWEVKQVSLVDMAVDRGGYIDQSQTLNIQLDKADCVKITLLHFLTWKMGLKTGICNLRSRR